MIHFPSLPQPRRLRSTLLAPPLAAIVAAWLAAPLAAQAQPALAFTSHTGAFLDGVSRMVGFQFSVAHAVQLSELGWFDAGQDGLGRGHEVGIWNAATQQLLASVTIPQGQAAGLRDQFRWVDLGQRLALQPGVNYQVAGFDPGHGDAHVWDASIGFGVQVSGFSSASWIQLSPGWGIGNAASQFGAPTGLVGGQRQVLMGPNLMIQTPVPEPATLLLMAAGIGALLLRSLRPVARLRAGLD